MYITIYGTVYTLLSIPFFILKMKKIWKMHNIVSEGKIEQSLTILYPIKKKYKNHNENMW